jgi:hypothetical protein
MTGGEQPYLLYGLGAVISLLVTMAGIPTLAFALGMYLPISINAAVLAGGIVAWFVARSGRSPREKEARSNQGILIASGMMAGAAIVGIVSAVLRLDWTSYGIRFLAIGQKFEVVTTEGGATSLHETAAPWYTGFPGQFMGLAMFVGLAVATFLLARWGANMQRAEEQKEQ